MDKYLTATNVGQKVGGCLYQMLRYVSLAFCRVSSRPSDLLNTLLLLGLSIYMKINRLPLDVPCEQHYCASLNGLMRIQCESNFLFVKILK